MEKLIWIITGLFVILPPALKAQKLSSKEKKIIQHVARHHAAALALLEEVVNVNSGTMNSDGVKKVGALFRQAFDEIGFETTWIDMPEEMQRGGHLFAEKKGNKGKRLLLIGHLDTVFEPDSPFQKYMLQDTIAKGPGANDMKGGNVIALYALKALHDAGVLESSQIIVAFHGDEEKTGKPLDISRRDIIEAAKRSDIALGFETASGFNYATVARRGSSGWKLEVTGKSAHSSGIFNERVGAGAVFETARILNAFYEEVKGEEFLTFNPGVLLGGTQVDFDTAFSTGSAFGKSNVVARKAVVAGGLRFISKEQLAKARAKMREITQRNLPHTSATISFTDSYPAMGPTEGNMEVLKVLNQVSIDLDLGEVKPYDPGKRGAADISFVAAYVDGLDGLGAMGGGAHSPREYVDLRTFEDLTKRAALLIYRLTR
ncbi:MAG: M20/M25/M40 family metallo-hydrolase [Cytophagales bacterium]|nr:M20/M25/M40 family metallo-hydrolase [Cytophagales bacterium]